MLSMYWLAASSEENDDIASAATSNSTDFNSIVSVFVDTHHGALVHIVFKNEPAAVMAAAIADHLATLTAVGVLLFGINLLLIHTDFIIISINRLGQSEVNQYYRGFSISNDLTITR